MANISRRLMPKSSIPLIAAMVALVFGFQLSPAHPALLNGLDFSATQLWAEPWRLLTPMLVHLDIMHTSINAAAWVFVGWLFRRHFSSRTLLNALIIIMVVTSLVVYLIGAPERFAGLSAVIHGVLVMGVLLE